MRYKNAKDGEWILLKRKNNYFSCCDCKLAHKVNFRIKNGKIEIQAFRIKK